MSRINDALKQAQQSPPPNAPAALPPISPRLNEPSSGSWLIPAIIIVLIFAGIFFISWARVRHHLNRIAVAQKPVAIQTTQTVQMVAAPVTQTPAVQIVSVQTPKPAVQTAQTNASVQIKLPRVQGIFYSPTAPTAILNGQTVRLGDAFERYQVKAISRYAVTLADSNGQEIKLNLGD